jgi:ABC-2 type transport system permease protein
MRKFLSIMTHEYARHVFRWRFLFSIMSLPALLAVALFVVYLVVPRPKPSQPIGIIDHSGNFAPGLVDRSKGVGLTLIQFDSPANASQALSAGAIQAYCIVPASYPHEGQIILVAPRPVNPADQDQLSKLIRAILLEGKPSQIVARLSQNNHLILRTSMRANHYEGNAFINIFAPVLAVFIFMLAIFSTSGYLMQAVAVEKENRTMELLLTSVSNSKLLIGKLCGIIAIGFTQLLVWLGMIYIVISIGQHSMSWFKVLHLPLSMVAVFCITISLAFVMIATMMIAVGAIVTQATEGQQITGPFSLPFILPFLFIYQIMNDPNGALAVWLSIIPPTSPITLIIRLSVTQLPFWQMILCLGIQTGFALILIWIARHAFRAGLLQYRRRPGWREIFSSG